jgi:hypothetical protein
MLIRYILMAVFCGVEKSGWLRRTASAHYGKAGARVQRGAGIARP